MSRPRPLLLLGDVASTQDEAHALARGGAPHGTVVVAEAQSAGRGRQGGAWIDAPGGSLLHSQILRPARAVQNLPTLSLVAGIAVAEAVVSLGAEARLKWPNDVLVDGRKVAGILADLHQPGPVVILGIGINVRPVSAVEETGSGGGGPTSLVESGVGADRLTVLRRVLECFDEVYAAWADRGFASLVGRYAALDCLAGTWIEGVGTERPVRGIVRGVDAHGALILESDGERRPVTSGAVRQVRRLD